MTDDELRLEAKANQIRDRINAVSPKEGSSASSTLIDDLERVRTKLDCAPQYSNVADAMALLDEILTRLRIGPK